MDIRVRQVVARMQEQLHTPLALRDLAAGVGLSVSALTRLFRQHTGKTPRLYLHDLRMTRARLLVERTSLAVAEVMTQVGISDPSHFARDFRRAHGYSPRTFRQQLRVGADPRWYVSSRTADDLRRNRPNGPHSAVIHRNDLRQRLGGNNET